MQVFFTHEAPHIAAKNISFVGQKPNGRKVYLGKKMIIESFQLLAMQLKLDGHVDEAPVGCSPSHQSHESRMWLEASPGNVRWLLDHALALIRLNGCPNGSKLNEDSIRAMSKIIVKNYKLVGPSLPALAMRSTAMDLCERHGISIQDLKTHTGKPKEYYRAKTFEDGTKAYREFLQRKDYYNPLHQLIK